MQRINIANVEPAWIRLLFLIIIGIPAFTGWPLGDYTENEAMDLVFHWVAYGCFIWLFIWLNMGQKELLSFLSLSFYLGMFTAIIGAMVRYALGYLSDSFEADVVEISFKMMRLLVIMITVIPYSLLFIKSFSASKLISRIDFNNKKNYEIKIHLATALRAIQHVAEIAEKLLEVWKEENPRFFWPRHRINMELKRFKLINWFKWLFFSALAWVQVLLMHGLEAVPYITEEMILIKQKHHKRQ
jgi:hypothetical protein